jgi:hypothetical protein
VSGISFLKRSVLSAGFSVAALAVGLEAAQGAASPPDFSSAHAGWISIGTDFLALPGSPPVITNDPAYPYVPNNTGRQPTFRVADVNNHNLTDFAKASLKKSNDMVLSGFAMYAREARCWASGVPAYLLNPAQPTFILQTPKKVTMIWQMDHQVRHIYMNVPHSRNPKPSWYGESVGHYEGDTLVIDTIGISDKSFLDNYRTPHTDKLHVVERYRLVDDGKLLQADVIIEDPAVLKQPWRLMHQWRRAVGPMIESTCAEGESYNPFETQNVEPLPVANRPDF